MEPDLPSGSWLLPQHPLMQRGSLMRGGWFPLPKLGHSRSSEALRAGSSSVKPQSLA